METSFPPEHAGRKRCQPNLQQTQAITADPYGYANNNPTTYTDPLGLYWGEGTLRRINEVGNRILDNPVESSVELANWAADNPGTAASAAAIVVCVSGVGTALCGVANAAAFGVRARGRIVDDGFRGALAENVADACLTLATAGLAGTTASIAENGGAIAVSRGSDIVIDGLSSATPAWQQALLRLGGASPDIAALFWN